MNRETIDEYLQRLEWEATEAMNKLGQGMTAAFRCFLVGAMLLLLSMARFCGVLDEQLRERTTEDQGDAERQLAEVR